MDPEPEPEPEERDSSPLMDEIQPESHTRLLDSYQLSDTPSRLYLMARLTNELTGYSRSHLDLDEAQNQNDTDADIDMFRLFSIDDHGPVSSSNPGVGLMGEIRNFHRHSRLRNAANRHISIIDNQLVQHHRLRRERRARQMRANRLERDITITVPPEFAHIRVQDDGGYVDTSTSDESYVEDGEYGFSYDFNFRNDDDEEEEDEEEEEEEAEEEEEEAEEEEAEEAEEAEEVDEDNAGLGELLTSESIASELNDRSRFELRRSETRRDGLVRVNTIKRHKPNSSREELRKDLIRFYEKHSKELSMFKRVVLGTELPLLSCIRRHYDIKSYVLTKEMNNFLEKSRSKRLFITNKRKLSTKVPPKRIKLNKNGKEYKLAQADSEKLANDGEKIRNDYKEKVLNVTFNSFLTIGSSFKVELNSTLLQFDVLTADYATKELMCLVTVLPGGNTTYGSHLSNFVEAFFENRFESNTRDLMNVVLDALKVQEIDDGRLFNFLIKGKMIDFKNRDLRTSMNMHRKYLPKWLNLPPFKKIMVPHLMDTLRKVTSPRFEKHTTSLFQQFYSICRILSDFQTSTNIFDLKDINLDPIVSDLQEVQKKHRIGVIDKVFDTAFMNFIICENCLFRLQAECIPFDLEIEDSILVELGDYIHSNIKVSDNKLAKFKKTKNQLVSKSTIMIGAVDRKNGSISLYNTRVNTIPSPYTRNSIYSYDKSPDGFNEVMHGHYMRMTDERLSTTGGGYQTFQFL